MKEEAGNLMSAEQQHGCLGIHSEVGGLGLRRIVHDPQMLFGIIFTFLSVSGGLVMIYVGFEVLLIPSSCLNALMPCWVYAGLFFVEGGLITLISILFWVAEVWPYIKDGIATK